MAGLNLYLLGGFQAKSNDRQALRFKTNKAQALLAYLASDASFPRSRDALAGLLWPEYPQASALTNLRSALASLRGTLGDHIAQPPFLNITRETVQFNIQSDHWLDLAEFTRPISGMSTPSIKEGWVRQYQDSIDHYRGSFLEGFPNINSAPFEEWILLIRGQLQVHALQILKNLADHFEGRGNYQTALVYARRQLEIEPWQEEAHQQLMRIYATCNQRSRALAQFDTCRRVLREGLGVEPSPDSIRLYEQIKSGEYAWIGSHAGAVVPELPDRQPIPFIARQGELSKLEHALQEALSREGQILFVTGESGSGKTTIMSEFVRRSVGSHPTLIAAWGRSNTYAGIGDPYLPFMDVLAMLTGELEPHLAAGIISRESARRLYSLAPSVVSFILDNGPDLIGRFVSGKTLLSRLRAVLAGQADDLELRIRDATTHADRRILQQTNLFEQYTRVLQAIALRYPLLIVIDDLQWADEASLSLLFHLGRRLSGNRILILGAYRPAEVATGREGRRHPLEAIVNEFQRVYGDLQVDLEQADGREFIEGLLDCEPNRLGPGFRQTLFQHTRGQPLFAIEFLRGLKEHGDLVRDESSYWVEAASLHWDELPSRVEAVISEHITRLPVSWQRALSIASVEGEDFTAEVVARVLEETEVGILRSLSGPLSNQHRLVYALSQTRTGAQRLSHFRFRHILYQKYLYTHLDPVERCHLHEAVGCALESLHGDQTSDLTARLAWHFEEAGLIQKSITCLQQAARRSTQLIANAEAVAFYRHALELLERLPENPQRFGQELELQMSLAVPLAASWGYSAPEVGQTYDRARQLCLQLGNTPRLVPALYGLGSYYSLKAKYNIARELYGQIRVIANETEIPGLQMVADWQMGYLSVATGQYSQGRTYLEKALAAYDPQWHDPRIYFQEPGVSILTWLARGLWILGYPDQALQRCQQALCLADERSDPFSQAFAYALAANLYHFCGSVEDTFMAARRAIEISTRYGFPIWIGFSKALHGRALALQGDIHGGLKDIHQGTEMVRAIGAQQPLIGCICLLAQTQAEARQTGDALKNVEEALQLELQSGGEFNIPLLFILKGDLLLLLNAPAAQVEACYQHAIDIGRRQEAKSWMLRASLSLCRLWQRQGRGHLVPEQLTGIYSWFREGFNTPDLLAAKALLGSSS